VSGELLRTPEYWVRHVREAVRFADGIRTLAAEGVTGFVELGPDSVLSAMGRDCLEQDDAAAETVFIPTARRDRPEAAGLLTALAELHVRGFRLDWPALLAGTGARSVELPTYQFQRRRYWPSGSVGTAVDAAALGLAPTGHPLIGAVVPDVEGDGLLLTSRLSLGSHPWLADHAVLGTVLFPGAGLVDLALHAGEQAGCEVLEELTLEAPLMLPAGHGVQVRIAVGESTEDGRRSVSIHSRREDEGIAEGSWVRHAAGLLAPAADGSRPQPAAEIAAWPPPVAEALRGEALVPVVQRHRLGSGRRPGGNLGRGLRS
jgi:acyl transferase domain-containing protein